MRYDKNGVLIRRRVQTEIIGESMTKQAHKRECDINHIMSKFQKTGIIEHQRSHGPQYMEVNSIDFHQAMNLVAEAQEMFEDLPSQIRKRFGNDPAAFLDFVQDEGNLEEMYDLGLAQRPPGKPAPVEDPPPEVTPEP